MGSPAEGYDNYVQTNIASGAFAFNGSWTSSTAGAGAVGGKSFADFLIGLPQNQATVFNHTEGCRPGSHAVRGEGDISALFVSDTFHVNQQADAESRLRWEFQGSWSDRFDRLDVLESERDKRHRDGLFWKCWKFLSGRCISGEKRSERHAE